LPDPFVTADGRPRLVCIEGYNVAAMLGKGLEALGGLESLVPDRRSVLIKPNLVLREAAGLPQYPTMSSPDVIRELIYLARAVSDDVTAGDQGGEDMALIYETLDLANAVTGSGARLLDFESAAVPTCIARRPEWPAEIPNFRVYREVHRAPVIFSLCNLKRHSSAFITGAVKNMFGALQGRWDSGTRAWLHRHPNLSIDFIESLPEVWSLFNPELTIVDARHIMIGNGPVLTNPGAEIRTGINRMVMGADPLALDAYCASRILAPNDPGFDPDWIAPMLKRGEELGLGTSDLGSVEIFEIDETWDGDGHE
jgi:uncharacterized protein (DUF362 family)